MRGTLLGGAGCRELGDNRFSHCLVAAVALPSACCFNVLFALRMYCGPLFPIPESLVSPGCVTHNSEMTTGEAVSRVFRDAVFEPVVRVPCPSEGSSGSGRKGYHWLCRLIVLALTYI